MPSKIGTDRFARTVLKHHPDSRLRFLEAHVSRRPELFREVVAEGLAAPQKWLPCRYFYDEAGSQLFEQICELPEYYLTRTERAILERYAPAMLAAASDVTTLVEFGSGSSYKTRLLLDAALQQRATLQYLPIDISGDFLYASAQTLLEEYPTLAITAIAAEYSDAIALLPEPTGPRLFLFLGSNIGNFSPCEATEFLERIRIRMYPEDRLLIGFDLRKSAAYLEPAYNDAAGVTAQFNKNLLVRINRELGADFDVDSFTHHAPFVETRSRIEMRLVSRCAHTVHIPALGQNFSFQQDEYIHTENSYKYSFDSFEALAAEARLRTENCWLDDREWFAVCLLRPFPR